MISFLALPFLLITLSQSPQAQDPFTLLRAGKLTEAQAIFQARAGSNNQDADAWLGLALVAHRQGRFEDAKGCYQKAIAQGPKDPDPLQGLAQLLVREGREDEARALLRRALLLDPARADIRQDLENLGDNGEPIAALVRPETLQMPCRVQGRHLAVLENHQWRPFFIKGINLGAALPGKYAAEFPDRETYLGWFKEMTELGVNTIRVYTIHPPHFYQALRDYNRTAKHPLYLIHGVWAELPPGHDFFNASWREDWRKEMRDVINVLHGQAKLPRRPGKSSGVFTADISEWTLAIILGREWESSSVVAHNHLYPGESDWQGRFLKVAKAHGMERFLAESMDEFLAFEWDHFHAQRPIAFTNWPTLDPLFHITESTEKEEEAWRKKLGLPEEGISAEPNDEDAASLDMEKFSALPACEAGLFASYHAYPYYPDFLNLDPQYSKARDAQGRNNYAGYLADLVRHHTRHPVMISEFGVPSCRMVAHWQPQGMTHGGQDEVEQGQHDARLLRNIYESGCAGGVAFAWIDEWFKKNWLCLPFYKPLDRKPFWYNAMDAEENYGFIGYHPGRQGPTILIDGHAEDWATVPTYLKDRGYELKVKADEGWLHLALFTPGGLDFSREAFLVGIDTVDPARGSSRLPWGLDAKSEAGLEFVALFQGAGRTGVWVDAPYALPEHRYHPRHRYRSQANDEGNFIMPTAKSNSPRISRDGVRYPGRSTEIGWLPRGTQDRNAPSFDSRSEWMEGRTAEGQGFLEARIPWTLLLVVDPSTRRLLDDPPTKTRGPVQSAVTPGFHLNLSILAVDGAASEGGATLKFTLPALEAGRIPLPPLFTWPTWEQPTFHRFRKLSFDIYKKALAEIPEWSPR